MKQIAAHLLVLGSITILTNCAVPQIESTVRATVENLAIEPESIDTSFFLFTQLPRPNSGTFSFEEAEKRKDEIYEMVVTPKIFEWESPTSGGALHINHNDEIEVYQFAMGLIYLGETIDHNDNPAVLTKIAPADTFFVISDHDIQYYVVGTGIGGNPASVLITSEINLHNSKSINLILSQIFEPATQIYYIKEK